MEAMNADAWNEGIHQNVSVHQLDNEVRVLVDLEKDYEAKKKISNEANAKYEEQRTLVLNLLQATGRSKYHAPGIGTVSMAIKSQIKVPHNPVDKKAMIEHFRSLDEALFYSYVSVNHHTLNSYYNQQLEMDPDFVIPGVGEKKETPELRIRKEK
jgi:hypothetical protein